jgi:hypothetical protein
MLKAVVATTIAAIVLGGCGFKVRSPDVLLLKRTGQGKTLTLLVNDGGTIRCNGGAARLLANDLLLRARDIADNLDKDAKAGLTLQPAHGGVYYFVIKVQNGTVSFGDKAGASHKELAEAELFAVQAAQRACGRG